MAMQDEKRITDSQIESILRQQEEHLHVLLQHSTDAIELLNEEGVITYASESLQYVLGYQPKECIGTNIFSYIHPDDSTHVTEKLRELVQVPESVAYAEYRVRHKNGSWVWVEATGSNHLHMPGIESIVANFRNITERKQAEVERNQLLAREQAARAEAEAARQHFLDLLMQAPAAICLLCGPNHVYELANALYLQIIGQRDIIGKPIREALPELAGQGIFELLDNVYTTGKSCIGNEVKVALDRLGDGEFDEAYFNFVYQPSRRVGEKVDGILVHAVEVTEQVRARQKVQENEARLRRLVDSNIIGISFTNINGAIIDANDSFLQMVGYTREDLRKNSLNWSKMTSSEYEELDRNALQEIKLNGAVSSPYEKEYIDKNGNRIPVLVGGALIDASRGEIVTFIIDIRQQKQMEQDLRQAKEQLEAILHNAADGITVQGIDGTVIYVNDVGAIMSGFPSAEAMLAASSHMLQQMLKRFVIKDETGNLLPIEELPGRRALYGEKNVQAIVQYIDTLTGQTHWSLVKAQPIFGEDGGVQLVVNVFTDISERQELEQRKNEFISMASHELKTPVTALKGFTNILQRRSSKQGDEQASHYLQRMDLQLNKLTKLINDLLDISKMQTGKLVFEEEIVDLTALIYEIVENLQGTTVTHRLNIEQLADIRVVGDKDRLGQVLINLLTNAIKYSPRANEVIIRAVTDGEQAIVSVQDFGMGIAETHHQQIFERFYQVTDPEERTYPGLGIGLYISHEFIRRHQGRIWVESTKGKGATFFFTIPLLKQI